MNSLATARTLAIVGSPTTPPDVTERKALALWADDAPMVCTWERVGQGDYRTDDPRLQAMADLHGPEELRQAAHRCRLILKEAETTLLVFSPWELAPLGLIPQTTIRELPHGNSTAAEVGVQGYRDSLNALADTRREAGAAVSKNNGFQNGINHHPLNTLNRIENGTFWTRENPPLPAKALNAPPRPPVSLGRGLPEDDQWIVEQLRLAAAADARGNADAAAFYRRVACLDQPPHVSMAPASGGRT